MLILCSILCYICAALIQNRFMNHLNRLFKTLNLANQRPASLNCTPSKFDSFRLKFIQKIQGIQLQLPPLRTKMRTPPYSIVYIANWMQRHHRTALILLGI